MSATQARAAALLTASWEELKAQSVALLTFQGYISVLQLFFLAIVLYFALTRAYLPRWSRDALGVGAGGDSDSLEADRAVAAKIAAWKPEPLALDHAPGRDVGAGSAFEDVSTATAADSRIVLTSDAGPVVSVQLDDGQLALSDVINMSSLNFLGLVGDAKILQACKDTMKKYGCGACGPRGFYGTVDVHLECEAALARMFGVDDAILYSFGSSAGSSVIPAFCKRGDIVVCDKGISFSLQTGVNLSRAEVSWFEHNDMADLNRALSNVTMGDVKDPRAATRQRRFIIVEGLYASYGDVAPLAEIVALKNKYHFRLILDESCSLGTLGPSGRGALEHFGIPRSDVEIATADLGNAFATIGGVCVGEKGVVSHQRLSGAGYCFSASQPPFLATAATEAIRALDKNGESLVTKSRSNTRAFRNALNVPSLRKAGWTVDGDKISPLLHIRSTSIALSQARVMEIQRECLKQGVLVAAPRYVASEAFRPRPSLRVAVSAAHDRNQVSKSGRIISEVLLKHSPTRIHDLRS